MNSYKTKGTCSREILLTLKIMLLKMLNLLVDVRNLLGIGSLVKGMKVDDAIEKIKGNRL